MPSLQEAGGGGPSGRVLPGWRFFCLDPGLDCTERPVGGDEGGVAAAPDVEGHIWGIEGEASKKDSWTFGIK